VGADPRELESLTEEIERLKWRISTLETVEFECARALNALSVSEARYRSLLEDAGFPITISLVSTSEILYANPVACQLFGLEGPIPKGRRMLEFYPDPTVRVALVDHLRQQGPLRDRETMLRDGNGRFLLVLLSASLVLFEGQEAILATSNDITARRHAEALFQTVVETSPDGVAIVDLEGHLTYVSPRIQKLLGHSSQKSLLGHHLLEFIPQEDHARAKERLQAIVLGDYRGPSEWGGIQSGGGIIPLEVNGEVLRHPDGTPFALILVVRDITNRKRLERTIRWTEKLESLGLMAAGIAHELNNAFQVTRGHLELAQAMCAQTDPLAGTLASVGEGVDRAAMLAKQMLDYSGRAPRMSSPLDLNEVVNEALALWRDLTPAATLTHVPGRDLPAVFADEGQMIKVVSALALNAIEAVEGRGGSTLISTEYLELREADLHKGFWPAPGREGPFLQIQVQDSGLGIAADQLERVCDPFFTTKGQGRGLGLSAALGILRAHSACLQILSQPGEGTTVRVYLPIRAQTPMTPNLEKNALPLPPGILVAEDDAAIRELVVRLLLGWGFSPVLAAEDGAKALELFQAHQPSIGILLTDATMPRMGGPESFAAMRKLSPSLRGVLMSGYSEAFGLGTVATFGFSGFLQKPFRILELKTKLESILASRRAEVTP
jgi:PAS domain S-box-containing protein